RLPTSAALRHDGTWPLPLSGQEAVVAKALRVSRAPREVHPRAAVPGRVATERRPSSWPIPLGSPARDERWPGPPRHWRAGHDPTDSGPPVAAVLRANRPPV